ncbi:MAG TPA: ABC transporter permease [Kiritimatiellia bacterium]|jgi:peptide/nickel transport system permease protein
MIRYIARRILQMIPTLFGVLVITFILFNVVGGSPGLIKLGKNATPKALEEFDEQRGFNKPLLFGHTVRTRAFNVSSLTSLTFQAGTSYCLPLAFPLRPEGKYEWHSDTGILPVTHRQDACVTFTTDKDVTLRHLELRRVVDNPFDSQLVFFIGQLARGDLGMSSSQNLPVAQILLGGIGPTLSLALPILVFETVISVSLALLCGYYRGRRPDRAMMFASTVLMSVNYLVWIVAGQYFLAFRAGWFPVWGFESWTYLALPVFIGVVSGLGAEVRFYRSVMLDELYRDYVRTAFAKGVSTRGVLFKHVLKNAMIPIVTNVVLAIPFLYTGSLLLESYFGIPGLGYLGVNAINDADVDVVRAVVVVGSVLYLFANLLGDLCYALVDPRVRLQ